MSAPTLPTGQGALLSLRGMTKQYPQRGLFGLMTEKLPPAVDNVTMEVLPGEVVGLIGESGSGKTTLARVAMGLIPFESGEVRLLGHPPRALMGGSLRRLGRRAQLLLQNPDASLNPGLRVRALLEESARLHQPENDRHEVVEQIAGKVGITHRLDGWPHELSGGEKRRVGIARLLLSDPLITLADEPTAGLDAALKADIADLLLARRGADRGYLIISHDLPLVLYACTRILVLYAGRMVEECPIQALTSSRHHPYTWSLLASAGILKSPFELRSAPPLGRGFDACPFYGPCPHGSKACTRQRPILRPLAESGTGTSRRAVACLALDAETEGNPSPKVFPNAP